MTFDQTIHLKTKNMKTSLMRRQAAKTAQEPRHTLEKAVRIYKRETRTMRIQKKKISSGTKTCVTEFPTDDFIHPRLVYVDRPCAQKFFYQSTRKTCSPKKVKQCTSSVQPKKHQKHYSVKGKEKIDTVAISRPHIMF